jgi:hypothetical protein
MGGNATEIIILGVLLFAVLMGILQILLSIWEGRKTETSGRTQ